MNNTLLCSIIATTYHRTFISQNGGLGTVTSVEALRLQRAGLGSIHTVDGWADGNSVITLTESGRIAAANYDGGL